MAESKGKCTHGFTRYSHILLQRRWTILHSCQCMRCLFLHSFAVEDIVELLKFGGSLFKISSLTAIFPSQTENIQVALPLEDHLEGKVSFKTYENYFTDGAGWPVIIFLILVNITAQVRKGMYFGLCTQLDVYVLFILYFINILKYVY